MIPPHIIYEALDFIPIEQKTIFRFRSSIQDFIQSFWSHIRNRQLIQSRLFLICISLELLDFLPKLLIASAFFLVHRLHQSLDRRTLVGTTGSNMTNPKIRMVAILPIKDCHVSATHRANDTKHSRSDKVPGTLKHFCIVFDGLLHLPSKSMYRQLLWWRLQRMLIDIEHTPYLLRSNTRSISD